MQVVFFNNPAMRRTVVSLPVRCHTYKWTGRRSHGHTNQGRIQNAARYQSPTYSGTTALIVPPTIESVSIDIVRNGSTNESSISADKSIVRSG